MYGYRNRARGEVSIGEQSGSALHKHSLDISFRPLSASGEGVGGEVAGAKTPPQPSPLTGRGIHKAERKQSEALAVLPRSCRQFLQGANARSQDQVLSGSVGKLH
jgi:hypothetical protein